MIRNSKQKWEIGQQVNVGFVKGLTVLAAVMTPGDYAPDAYVLSKGTAFYSFVPHNGLSKITQDEASAMIADGKREQARADTAAAVAIKAHVEAALFRASVLAGAELQAAA